MKMMYPELRAAFFLRGITQDVIAEKLGKSRPCISHRFTGRDCFTIDEGYQLLEMIEAPHTDLPIYFPSKGVKT